MFNSIRYIIHLPFTPFIVIFCNVIATSDLSDLANLQAFLSTLESAAKRSEAAEKLYHLCFILHRVAALYVEAKSRSNVGTPSNDDFVHWPVGELGPYLNALGFAPHDMSLGTESGFSVGGAAGTAINHEQRSLDSQKGEAQAANLEDWFSGAQHIMGLLEEDLSFIKTL